MTKYYCENCDSFFEEKKAPNINRIHYQCGRIAKVVLYEGREDSSEE